MIRDPYYDDQPADDRRIEAAEWFERVDTTLNRDWDRIEVGELWLSYPGQGAA